MIARQGFWLKRKPLAQAILVTSRRAPAKPVKTYATASFVTRQQICAFHSAELDVLNTVATL